MRRVGGSDEWLEHHETSSGIGPSLPATRLPKSCRTATSTKDRAWSWTVRVARSAGRAGRPTASLLGLVLLGLEKLLVRRREQMVARGVLKHVVEPVSLDRLEGGAQCCLPRVADGTGRQTHVHSGVEGRCDRKVGIGEGFGPLVDGIADGRVDAQGSSLERDGCR